MKTYSKRRRTAAQSPLQPLPRSSVRSSSPLASSPGPISSPPTSPLSELSASAVNAKRLASSPIAPSKVKRMQSAISFAPIAPTTRPTKIQATKRTRQTQLLVGADSRATCSECGMSYIPTSSVDQVIHAKFHTEVVEGRDWPVSFGTPIAAVPGGSIVKVDASSRGNEKEAVRDILNMVNTELAAPLEPQNWVLNPGKAAAYVYVSHKRAIGILLAERISEAYWMDLESCEIVSGPTVPAIMGISRIFAARDHRRSHIATRLLDVAAKDFVYGVYIDSKSVAWSQPSVTGAKVARAWGGFASKIPVYLEEG